MRSEKTSRRVCHLSTQISLQIESREVQCYFIVRLRCIHVFTQIGKMGAQKFMFSEAVLDRDRELHMHSSQEVVWPSPMGSTLSSSSALMVDDLPLLVRPKKTVLRWRRPLTSRIAASFSRLERSLDETTRRRSRLRAAKMVHPPRDVHSVSMFCFSFLLEVPVSGLPYMTSEPEGGGSPRSRQKEKKAADL